jgi:oxygen-independent coproporphyrinogen-3 oxidase
VQSFNDQKLKALGRIHNATEARAAIDMAIQAGFENINLDLMYALPEQTLAEALFDIETATAYPITHLSHYQLTLEPNTLFAKFPPDLPNEDDSWVIQKACQEYIHSQGFNQYEVSAYAREGLRSRHNLNYWRFGDYLGIGAGAHGKITHSDNSIIRTAKPRHPTQYLQYAVNEEFMQARQVPDKAIAFEYGLNQLRLYEAFSENDFEQRTGLGFDRIEPILNSAQTKGWIERSHKSITVTPLGKRFMNDLQALFL